MGVARLYTLPLPFNAGDLADLDYVQSADVVYLAHWSYTPSKVQRLDHDQWAWSAVTFGPTIASPGSVAATPTVANDGDGPLGSDANSYPEPTTYVVTAISDVLGQESRPNATPASASNDLSLKGNYNTVTWAAVTGATSYAVYKSDTGIDSIHGFIGETEGLSFYDRNISPDYSDTPPQARNPFDGSDNWPSTTAIFEQRLIFARTKAQPNGLWLSKAADYENHDVSRPQRDDDAISMAIAAGTLNEVNQIATMQDLVAMTSDSAWKISGNGADGFLKPPAAARRLIGEGASRLDPIIIGSTIMFWPAVGAEVKVLAYALEADGYRTKDVAIFSSHLFEGREVVSWAYQRVPHSVVWCVMDDGKALALTWQEDQGIWGWTRIDTAGEFESVCAVTEGKEDRVYFVVRRTVNGVQRRYIERMGSALWQDYRAASFLDASVNGAFAEPSNMLGGLYHLAGVTVTALLDGAVVTDLVVSATGQVTFPYPATRVVIGRPYVSEIETLPLTLQYEGAMQSKRQMIGKVVMRLKDSRGLHAGTRTLYPIKDRDTEGYGNPPDLLTGDYEINTDATWSSRATVKVQQHDPLPMILTGLFLEPQATE